MTHGYEQTVNGKEEFFSVMPAVMHLKMMLVDAVQNGHVVAIGDWSGRP